MKKKVLSISLILVILLSLCPDISAHAETGVAFYLTHKHIGNKDVCGGCYTSPHYHVHSDPGSGDCYTPRYHEHTGSPSGGGCYTVPVPHEHTGDSTQAGGCYVPRYHSHNSDCYRRGYCDWVRTLTITGSEPSWCHIHGDIYQVLADVTESHSSCGLGSFGGQAYYCPSCGYQGELGGGTHEYSELVCTKGSYYVEGYVLGCGHSEGDLDHYDPGCGMEGVIEGYDLTCTKTSLSVDQYDPGCGMDEGQNAVAVKVGQNRVSGGMEITVSLEDQSGGVIDVSDAGFIWKDADGNELGSGNSLTVSSNGTYGLEVVITDEGINPDSCSGNVEVTGIRPPGSDNGNGTSDEDPEEDDGTSYDDGNSGGSGQEQDSGTGDDDDTYYASATPTPTPTATPITMTDSGSGNSSETRTTESGSKWRNDDDSGSDGTGLDVQAIGSGIPVDGLNKNVTVEKKKVEALKTDAGNEENLENGEMNDTDQSKSGGLLGRAGKFLKTPAGKVITIGVSTALLIGALFLLLLLLRNLVIVFNFDGHMKRHFTGLAFIRLKKDGYELEIPDEISSRAYTNRYEFFMGFFMIGRERDIEIMVIKKDRQMMVKVERMMRVTI